MFQKVFVYKMLLLCYETVMKLANEVFAWNFNIFKAGGPNDSFFMEVLYLTRLCLAVLYGVVCKFHSTQGKCFTRYTIQPLHMLPNHYHSIPLKRCTE